MGKVFDKLVELKSKIFIDQPDWADVYPTADEVAANPELLDQAWSDVTAGKQRALDVVKKMRAAYPDAVTLELPRSAQMTDEQHLYIDNPGHNPLTQN